MEKRGKSLEENHSEIGFEAFIVGPSKTAEIEDA
jgi:L-lactate utilization protein LutC